MSKVNNLTIGYDLADYEIIFSLSENELKSEILEIPNRYSSFNADFGAKGGRISSFNELFTLSTKEITELLSKEIIDSVKKIESELAYDPVLTAELTKKNEEVLTKFLASYQNGDKTSGYVGGEITALPFKDQQFTLALCCNNLFGMQKNSNFAQDLQIVTELLRVSRKVKIFPLNDLQSEPCEYLGKIMMHFQELGYRIEVIKVNNKLSEDHNAMLCIWNTECIL